MRKLLAGLREFVAATDLAQLDAALARPATVPVVRVTAPCRFAASSTASRASLRCVAPVGTLLEGTLAWQAGRLVDGDLTRLTLADGTALNAARLRPAGHATPAVMKLQPLVDGRAARTAAGNAIAVIEVRRPAGNDHGEVMIEVRQDFAIVQQAVDRLVSGPQAAALFAPAPFPREPLFAALFGELGMAGARGGTGCCQAARALPPPQLEVPAVAPAEPAAAAMPPAAANDTAQRSFQPYCAACHQTAETFPPNFLQGSPAEVVARLRHCAPRLYVRLAMADVAPEQREKTPMPPESVLPAFASSPQAWRSSPLRAALLAQVEGWLRAETGQSSAAQARC
jgi:mono/diheme cytochrome c family protein